MRILLKIFVSLEISGSVFLFFSLSTANQVRMGIL